MMYRLRRHFSILLILLIFLLVFSLRGTAAEKEITILHTADIHGHIYPWSYELDREVDARGLAKVNTLFQDIKKDKENVLFLDSGDTIQGSSLAELFKERKDLPHPVISAMNKMGYDAMVLGNHEFNFGVKTLVEIMEEADFPVLSANITYREDDRPFTTPYVIKEVEGVRIGILGLTTPNIPRWEGDKVKDLSFAGMTETAERYVKDMKKEGTDVIIALAHAGLEGRNHPAGGDKIRKVAENIPEIEVILTGHDHICLNTIINDVLIVAPEEEGSQIVQVDIELNGEPGSWNLTGKDVTHHPTEDVRADGKILDLTRVYHEKTVNYVNTPIGRADGDFLPSRKIKGIPEAQIQDTALMDLINKVQLEYSDADISSAALFNRGADLNKGEITIKDITHLYSYSNKLYTVEISGAELKEYMEHSAAYYNRYRPGDITISFNPDMPGYSYDMFAGVDYKIDISEPEGERIKNLEYKGEPVQKNDQFTLALNDFRYTGLKSAGIINGEPDYRSDREIKDMIIDYIRKRKVIEPEVDNNWEIIGADLDHWARPEALMLYNQDKLQFFSQTQGRNEKSINLEEGITREILVKTVVDKFNYEKPEEKEETDYIDISKEMAGYVRALEKEGIETGRSKYIFGADDVLSREEAAALLYDSLKIDTFGDKDYLDRFTDGDKVSSEYKREVVSLLEMGVLSGRSDNLLAPKDEMKLGEFASMFYRYLMQYSL
ncbi:MAG: bifunctional metallophosphatase/5'-nucleotidase [Halanaerobiales bacterium]